MRVVVMSDIHGFSLALDAVIGDMARIGDIDAVIVAGDLCEVGPDPLGVLDRLRAHPDWIILKGNTDDDLVTSALDGEWTYAASEIGTVGVRWLASLPFSHRVHPPGHADDTRSLLVVHANPYDLRGRLDPTASDDELRGVISDAVFQTLAFGHVHISYRRQLDGRQLVDVSAVGNPKDGDLRCAYGILTWDEDEKDWLAEIRRLEYPLDETVAQIQTSSLPNPDKVARVLHRATY